MSPGESQREEAARGRHLKMLISKDLELALGFLETQQGLAELRRTNLVSQDCDQCGASEEWQEVGLPTDRLSGSRLHGFWH